MPINIGLDLTRITKELTRLSDKQTITKNYKKALYTVAKQINNDSKSKVPQDTLDLLNSWVIKWKGDDLLAGYDIIYAMYQHQGRRADGTHIIRNRPAGGQSFYLSTTLTANVKKYYKLFEREFFKNIGL